MPTIWAYRTSTGGTTRERTLELLDCDAFLCRTAFSRSSNPKGQLIPYLSQLRPGDHLHVYYASGKNWDWLGSFLIEPPRCVEPEVLVRRAPALDCLDPTSSLAIKLERLGYLPDPYLGRYTGLRLRPAMNHAVPLEKPRFAGRNALGTFSDAIQLRRPLHSKMTAPAPMQSQNGRDLSNSHQGTGMLYGVDWSGARRAGDKIWVAQLDPGQRLVLKVSQPWQALGHPQAARSVATWLCELRSTCVAIDTPFGLAARDRQTLVGGTPRSDPRSWAKALIGSYPDSRAFIDAVVEKRLIGKHRRATEVHCRTPFSATLYQLIHQTYAAFQLLSQLDQRVRILPWDVDHDAPVTLVETCPAVLIKSLGYSNRGYKLKPGSQCLRRQLLQDMLTTLDWRVTEGIADIVERDAEGDALDAILCGLAADRALAMDHGAISRDSDALNEGWIYY